MKRSLVTIFAVAALLLAGFACFVQFAPFSISTAQNQNDTNLIRIQDYLQAPDRNLVLVGSSLTFLLPQSALGSDAANLGLAGDSPRTGLQLIRDAGARPGLVLVESNLLLHPGNENLVHAQLRFPERELRRMLRAFRTGYDPVNLLWRGLVVFVQGGKSAPAMPAAIRQQLVQKQKEEKSRPPDPARLSESLARVAALIRELQKRNIKVGFYEMPIDPVLANSPFDMALRREVLRSFPEEKFCWLRPRVAGAQTLDGIHLTPSYAVLVAHRIRHSAERCR